ncbi:MAG: hypothetical protein RL385_612 [Pseudomonadota bacterium]|jgi:hypothetical protein
MRPSVLLAFALTLLSALWAPLGSALYYCAPMAEYGSHCCCAAASAETTAPQVSRAPCCTVQHSYGIAAEVAPPRPTVDSVVAVPLRHPTLLPEPPRAALRVVPQALPHAACGHDARRAAGPPIRLKSQRFQL